MRAMPALENPAFSAWAADSSARTGEAAATNATAATAARRVRNSASILDSSLESRILMPGRTFFQRPDRNKRHSSRRHLVAESSTTGQHLHEPVEILVAAVKRFHRHPFVPAVNAPGIAGLHRHAGMTVGRDPGVAKEGPVGGAGAHHRNHRGARPELVRQFLDRADDLLI